MFPVLNCFLLINARECKIKTTLKCPTQKWVKNLTCYLSRVINALVSNSIYMLFVDHNADAKIKRSVTQIYYFFVWLVSDFVRLLDQGTKSSQ